MTLPVSILSAGVLALSAEYYFLALFLLAVALYLVRTANAQASRAEAMNLVSPVASHHFIPSFSAHLRNQTVKTLDELISSGNQWDSVVNEAMTLIERDERRQVVSVYSCFNVN